MYMVIGVHADGMTMVIGVHAYGMDMVIGVHVFIQTACVNKITIQQWDQGSCT